MFVLSGCPRQSGSDKLSKNDDVTVNERRRRPSNDRLTITKVAKRLGVSTKSIVRWEKAGKICKIKRDWRGWRIFDEEDLVELKTIRNQIFF